MLKELKDSPKLQALKASHPTVNVLVDHICHHRDMAGNLGLIGYLFFPRVSYV